MGGILGGVVVIGKFEDPGKISTQIRFDIKEAIGSNFIEYIPKYGDLTKLTVPNSTASTEFFHQDKPMDQRPYTIMPVLEYHTRDEQAGFINILLDKRHLKLIPIIFFESIANVDTAVRDSIFAVCEYFVVGKIVQADAELLKKLSPKDTAQLDTLL